MKINNINKNNNLLIFILFWLFMNFSFSVYANNSNEAFITRVETDIIEASANSSNSEMGPNLPDDFYETDFPSEKIYHKTIFSLIGHPKYSDGFTHLDYVNSNAPKGGMIKLAEIGSFDNFNRFASRGVAERNTDTFYDSLFTNTADDITSFYPLIGSSITYSDRYQWAEVTLNPNAKFQDGTPITAEDVAFTFHKFMTEGVSQYRTYYRGCNVIAITPYLVRFEIAESDREKLLSFAANMLVIPKHFWQNRNFSEPLTTPPVGSSAYFISDYKLGQYVIYQRNPTYWAQNLPVNKGLYNFDKKRIDYYMDSSVALEAFKAGEYDFRSEGQPKNWFTQYQGQYFDLGYIKKQEKAVTTATDTQWLAFNLQKALFNDLKVRQAITLAFDFEWLNKAFYYNSYKRPYSFFENTPYAATQLPDPQELDLLMPFKDILPKTVFSESYQLPKSNGRGFDRANLLKATQLLKEAGWIVKKGQLINATTHQPFQFELLVYLGADIKYAIPFQQNLARLGIKMDIVTLDQAQLIQRMRKRDYDMMQRSYSAFNYPTTNLAILWGSQHLNSTWNASGLHNHAIDTLINEISQNLDNEDKLIPLGRALDRILIQEYPMIPMWYPSNHYFAYWNKFGIPYHQPTYGIGLDSWWYDSNKAQILPKNQEH